HLNLHWLGVEGRNFDATIDMGGVIDVREVGAHFSQNLPLGISVPAMMDVLVSGDGKEFRKVATVTHDPDKRKTFMRTLSAKLKGVPGRFVKVVGYANGMGVFADEVFVNPEPGGGLQDLDCPRNRPPGFAADAAFEFGARARAQSQSPSGGGVCRPVKIADPH